VADTFWRFEDLWQSPTGDVGHASNFRSAVRCDLPRFQCTAMQGWGARRSSAQPYKRENPAPCKIDPQRALVAAAELLCEVLRPRLPRSASVFWSIRSGLFVE
jgi:hypothetical protein